MNGNTEINHHGLKPGDTFISMIRNHVIMNIFIN